jgi:uncharacterized protein
MPPATLHSRSPFKKVTQKQIREDGSFTLAVVSDTHSLPHASALDEISRLHPDAILHTGDIGELWILDKLATICPVYAVRGNIDPHLPELPDVFVLELTAKDRLVIRIVALHVGVYGPKLRSEVFRMAQSEAASVVMCGHSHIPFIGNDRGLMVFNPGSIGPRRSHLPIVFGMLELSSRGFRLRHIDCETGLPWKPPC